MNFFYVSHTHVAWKLLPLRCGTQGQGPARGLEERGWPLAEGQRADRDRRPRAVRNRLHLSLEVDSPGASGREDSSANPLTLAHGDPGGLPSRTGGEKDLLPAAELFAAVREREPR